MRIRILLSLLFLILTHTLFSQESPILWMKGRHNGQIASMSRVRSLVATVSSDSTFRLWDESSGNLLIRYGFGSAGTAVALSDDGSLVAAGDSAGRIRVWSTATGRVVARLPGFDKPVRCVAFSPDAREVTAAAGDELTTWQIGTTTTIRSQQLEATVRSSVASAGMIVLGLENGRLAIIDKGAPETIRTSGETLSPITALALDVEEATLVAGSASGTLSVVDTRDWLLVKSIAAHTGSVLGVAISPDGLNVVSSGEDGALHYRRVADDSVLWSIRNEYLPIGALALSSGSEHLLVGDLIGRLTFLETATGEISGSVTMGELETVAHGGSRIGIGKEVISSPYEPGYAHAGLRVVESVTGLTVARIDSIQGGILSTDGSRLVTYDVQGVIRTVDASNGLLLSTQRIDTGWISLIGWGPAGEIAVAADRGFYYSPGCFTSFFRFKIGLWDTTSRRFSRVFTEGEDLNFGWIRMSSDWKSASVLSSYIRCDGGYWFPPLKFISRTKGTTECYLPEDFTDAAASTRNSLLAVINEQGTAELIDPFTLDRWPIGRAGRAIALTFSSDESIVAVSERGGSIVLIDVASRAIVRTLDDFGADQTRLVFAGDYLVTAAVDGTTIVRRFETTPTAVPVPSRSTPARLSVSLSSNVVSSMARISISTASVIDINVELVTVTGERSAILFRGESGNGHVTLPLESASYVPGMYWCVVTAGTQRQVIPVLIVR